MQNFLNRYENEFGENLANLVEAHPQYQITPQGFYNRTHRAIENYIKQRNYSYSFEECEEYQKKAVLDAEIYQAFYVIHGIDFNLLSGYSATSGALVDKLVIVERAISKDAFEILRGAGVLHLPIMGVPKV